MRLSGDSGFPDQISAMGRPRTVNDQRIVLDRLVPIELSALEVNRFHNELQVLNAWVDGLYFLYRQIRQCEEHTVTRPPVTQGVVFSNLSCCFQWYAVTLCNFVELTGAIGWELDPSRKPPRDYIKDVIPAVLDYRNKVGAHVGRARRKKANAAEQLASLLPPSALVNGRYTAGAYAVHIRRSGNSSLGKTEAWSLTDVHQQLADRYWPNLT